MHSQPLAIARMLRAFGFDHRDLSQETTELAFANLRPMTLREDSAQSRALVLHGSTWLHCDLPACQISESACSLGKDQNPNPAIAAYRNHPDFPCFKEVLVLSCKRS